MPTKSSKLAYVKSFISKGQRYNSLRYKDFPVVHLPKGPVTSREVREAHKIALEAYQRQEDAAPAQVKKKTGTTLSGALSRYLETPAFEAMEHSTREKRRYILTALCKSGIPGVGRWGDVALADITRDNIKAMLIAREKTPSACRNLLVALQHFFSERVGSGNMKEQANPVLGIRLERRVTKRFGKYPTWKQSHVEAFRAKWGPETMERLAFEVMYATGMAVADAIRFSRSWVEGGLIPYFRRKTATKGLPVFTRELRDAIAACPLVQSDNPFEPVLRDQLGRVWYVVGEQPMDDDDHKHLWRNQDFSQWFTKACRAAGIPDGISAHGVRKRAACDDALKGWNTKKLMSKFGWTDPKEAARYTLEAEMELEMRAEAAKDAAD